MRRFLLPLLLLSLSKTIAQDKPPTPEAVAAYKLEKAGDLAGAIVNWKKDYAISHIFENAYQIAGLSTIARMPDSAFVWLEIGSIGDSSTTVFKFPELYPLVQLPQWTAFEDRQLKKVAAKNGPFKKPELAKQLLRLGMKDETYSYEANLANRLLGDTSPVSRAVWDLQRRNRAENLVELDELLVKHGWPLNSEVGEVAARAAFYVVQHASETAARKMHLQKLKAACEKAEAAWDDYAMMFDRLMLAETGKQLYGTQMTYDQTKGLMLRPIEAPEYLEKRRKALGLKPLPPRMDEHGLPFSVPQKE